MKFRTFIGTICLMFSGCTQNDNPIQLTYQNNIKTSTDNLSKQEIIKPHSSRVMWILEDMDYTGIGVTYEKDSDIGIFHMQGVRVYVFDKEKEKYFASKEYDRLMMTAVKYFIFAAERETELCKKMTLARPLNIEAFSSIDVFEKRPLYMYPPKKVKDNVYEVKLEYILTNERLDIPVEKRHSVIIELSIERGYIFVSNFIFG